MVEKVEMGNIRKGLFLTALLALMFIFIIDTGNAFSSDTEGQVTAQGQEEEIRVLKNKVNKLEKTVENQAALIEQQKQILDKLIKVVPQAKEALAPPELKTLVKKFVINGANLFTAKDFEPVLNKYRDKELSMTDLKKVADEITLFYRKKGYITSLAYVPEQEIVDNTVEFKVVEGRVGNIKVEKPKYSKAENVEKRFLVEEGEILDSNKLDVNLHRINQEEPDRTMRAVLSPGSTKESSNILLKIDKERSPQHFSIDFNNRGTKDTGLNRYGVTYRNNNLLGNEDALAMRFNTNISNNVYSGSAAYDFPVSRYNTRFGMYGAYSKADVGGQFAVLSPQGVGVFGGLYVSHPWLDKKFFDEATSSTMALKSNLTAGFDAISVRNKLLSQETSDDQLRVLKGGVNFEETDSWGRGGLTAEIQAGIPGFLGSMGKHDAKASRVDAGGEFQKYGVSMARITPLPASLLLINSFKGQFTPSRLVSSEQMLFGGADSVRGYPEADYLADYGWMMTAELRAPFFLLPPELKVPFDKKHTSWVNAIQLVGFLDAGEGYLNDPRVGELGHKQLVGAGFGLRVNLYDSLRAMMDIGYPIANQKPSDNSTHTIHFGVEYDW